MAKETSIVSAAKKEVLNDTMKDLIQSFNADYEKFVSGFWGCIKTVHTAMVECDKIREEKSKSAGDKVEREFFMSLTTNNDKSMVSKMKTCAKNLDLLTTYRDDIPQNMTSYYMVAKHPDAVTLLPKLVESGKLNPDCSTKEVTNLFRVDDGGVRQLSQANTLISFSKSDTEATKLNALSAAIKSDATLMKIINSIKEGEELRITVQKAAKKN